MHDRTRVMRRDLDGRVRCTRGGSTDQKRDLHAAPFHLRGDMDHFIQRRRDQPAKADDIRAFLDGGGQNLVARHHDSEVGDFKAIAGQHDTHDVLADVMHVTFDRGHDDPPRAALRWVREFLLLHEGLQISDALLHHAGAFHDLREEHFASAKKIAHNAHAVHERTFDDEQRLSELIERLLSIDGDEVGDAFEQRVFETLLDGGVTPLKVGLDLLAAALAFELLSVIDKDFGSIGTAIQQHVLDFDQQLLRNFLIHFEHPRVHDAHVHACFDGVIKEGAVHGLAHLVVAAEAEADV